MEERETAPGLPVGIPLQTLLRAGWAGNATSSSPESWVDPAVPCNTCVRAQTSLVTASRVHGPFVNGDPWGGDFMGPQNISLLV